MPYTLCYVSTCIEDLSAKDLEHLFRVNKRNNVKLDISGILIYNNGNFLQILEGHELKIKNLFNKIKLDSRHQDIIPLINMSIDERIFNDYESGFVVVQDQKKLHQLESYLNWIKEAELITVDKIIRIVENFIDKK